MANPQLEVRAVGSGGQLDVNVLSPDDNVGYAFGTDSDAVFYLSSAVIAAGSETTGLHAGSSSVKQATAVDSLIISNITTDGDIQMLVSDGDSKEFLFADGSAANLVLGHGMATATIKTASGDLTLAPAGNIVASSDLDMGGYDIDNGVWQGTDIGVAYGGTGVSTLTANGVLIGNGASAVAVTTTMATKGHVMIGDGSGVPSMLGVGTNTHVMTADSGEATGVKWAAPAAAAAGSLTGATLASGVTASALTSLGTQAEDLDMGGYDIDNAGFVILNAATAPASTEVYALNDNSGDLTVNALSGKEVIIAIAGTDEYKWSATRMSFGNNNVSGVGALQLVDPANTQTATTSVKNTQDITTSATPITTASGGQGALCLVTGQKTTDSNVRWFDLVVYGSSAGIHELLKITTKGSPDGRTYTNVSSELNLAMDANTYNVTVLRFDVSNPS
jgi:hypothetical protein